MNDAPSGWIIGRADSCHMTIVDKYVSLRHAVITQDDDGRAFVADLGSVNGTYVIHNGVEAKVIGRRQIWPGDVVVVGRTKIPWTAVPKTDVEDSNA